MKATLVLWTFVFVLCDKRTGSSTSTDASNIANYDIKRCYEVDITVYYRIPEGLTLSHNDISNKFAPSFSMVSSLLRMLPQCSGVQVTMGVLQTSPPGQSIVFVKQTVVFTALAIVADADVSSKLTTCISVAKSYGKILDSNFPSLSQNGVTYGTYNKSTISDKRSCCGGDIPPPCCAVGSVKVSSTKCGCSPGYHFVPGSLCVRCPSDTYQNKQGETSCKKCPSDKKTFGKTGASVASNCTANNPLQILEMKTIYLPRNIRPGAGIVNVTVTGKLASLVQPFLYYIDKLTQLQQSSNGERRRRREARDVCEEAGTIPPLNYFCIYRRSGQITVTGDFSFKDGDEFELIIRVTDSDRLGKTENTAKVKFISRDDCRDIREAYEEAVKFCAVYESLSPGSCPSVKCLQSLYNWQKVLSLSTEALRHDCSFDPNNLTALTQKYYSCIGPPVVSLDPVSLKVRLGSPAVLTCNATSPLNLTIVWFKDGAPLQLFGNHLRIPKVEHRNQGYYSCKFSTVVTSSFSKHAPLLLDGVLTSIVSFKILNKKYDADLSELQINVERNMENYLNSGRSPWNYIANFSNFRDLSGKVGVVLVLYSDVETKDVVEYYAGLDKLLQDGDISKIFSSLRISQKSITIRSATYCLPEETGKQSVKGVFEWKLKTIGQNASLISCPYGPPPAQAIRFCGGNFTTGGVWTNPDKRSCKYKSERTNKLDNLNKTAIDEINVVQVTKEVKSLTSSPDEMNEADANLIADVIEDVVALEGSLNEVGQDVLDVIDNVMNMKKGDLQESQRSNKASSKFVRALDKVAESLPLSDGQLSRSLVAPSVAVQTNRVNPASFNGLSLAVQTPTADPSKLTADSIVNEELLPKDVQTSISLPETLFQNKTPSNVAVKMGFVIYQNDKFFQPAVSDELDEEESIPGPVISRVASISVQDLTFQNLTRPVELVFQPAVNVDESSGNFACVFWDFGALDGFGNWANQGCKQVNSEAGRVQCHCDHMTNFAVLFSASGPTKHVGKHAKALSIISYVGCAISLVGLTITLLTYALFRNLRKTNQQPILMSLCVSLMLLLIVFIAGAGRTENLVGCRIVAVLIHYFALSSVLWMGVEGYNMYMSFVQVMATYQSKFILKASAVAWGLSAIVVIITVSAATGYYGNDDFCVLHGVPFQAAMFAPVLLIILINFVIFFLALRSLARTGALVSAEKKSTSYQRARTSVAILILLGLTWVFGALAVSRAQLAFDYLFCIFNSLQGFIIFYFHCLRHQEVRNQWKWFLLGKGRRYHPSSSESRTGCPKTNSKANKNYISNSSPMRKSFGNPRKETVSMSGSDGFPKSPTLDIVPAEV